MIARVVGTSSSSDLPRLRSTQEPEHELRRLTRLRLAGQLVDGIVHDFRNALGAVVGFIDWKRAHEADPEQLRSLERADAAITDVLRMLRVVTRLTLARGRAAEPIALADLAADAHSLLVTRARHRGITLQVVDRAPQTRVFAVTGDALGLVVRLGLHALSTASPGAPDPALVTTRLSDGPRSYGCIAWHVSGDPSADRELQEWVADPSRGLAGVRAAMNAEGELTGALAALVIAGGRLQIASHVVEGVTRRTLAVWLPCATNGGSGGDPEVGREPELGDDADARGSAP